MIWGGADVIFNNNRTNVHNKCNALQSSPSPKSMEKLSSTKPVSGAKKIGDCWYTTEIANAHTFWFNYCYTSRNYLKNTCTRTKRYIFKNIYFSCHFLSLKKQSQLKVHYQGNHCINYAMSLQWNNIKQLKKKVCRYVNMKQSSCYIIRWKKQLEEWYRL